MNEHDGGRAYLLVRATVRDPELRDAFDTWYATDHAPLAVTLLRAQEARRFWSLTDPSVHCALYTFPDERSLRAAMDSAAVPRLLAEFDERWPEGVSRTRELLLQVDHIAPPPSARPD